MQTKRTFNPDQLRRMLKRGLLGTLVVAVLAGVFGAALWFYIFCRIEVPSGHIAVLIKKTGAEIDNATEIVPVDEFGNFKGLQEKVLTEGRYFYNPWNWEWDIVPQVEIPENRLGVRIRLYGDDLGYGNLIADQPSQKGIAAEVLRPGRYPINAIMYQADEKPRIERDNYAELIELHKPIVVPAGFKGVVTLLSAPMADDPNQLLVEAGRRGVQSETLNPGVYYINPYVQRINLIDCRSQRFNLSNDGEMGFPSRDGFWVRLDGRIEFRVDPTRAAEVFVTYNDSGNDQGFETRVEEEIIAKIILPNARSFCRLRGSDNSGRDFILGDKRLAFQQDFQATLEETCKRQGIKIVQALITRISPPQQIASPVRDRQIATQQAQQYVKQIEQQTSEQQLRIEQELVKQKEALVEVEREVVKLTIQAQREQEVAVIEAEQGRKVAEVELAAGIDQAGAITAKGEAQAEVVRFGNEADAAGWAKAVEAYDGDGDQYARWVMLKKLAPSFRQMMVNTADSPLMDIFNEFNNSGTADSVASPTETSNADSTSTDSTTSNQE
ncbi:Regulator of protease activity HflC, stomatin/prohibitin superfamily [Neorhodopirellula lusitana]|uniref:Regulator of protease activity HflC, stomatin/prohibitin superfamily n=1 Tax=Neorhodopirellula lusitana TaxID=445327 RepID=A0ABY1QGY4_9BACT|nr:SPFH domain-containing protein [Neorhodopirellula lusitana]SMP70219.1 Regulator of protease activity HflC, stomatin/prohibitin superfamily [Neorhodopirellula lusitana]